MKNKKNSTESFEPPKKRQATWKWNYSSAWREVKPCRRNFPGLSFIYGIRSLWAFAEESIRVIVTGVHTHTQSLAKFRDPNWRARDFGDRSNARQFHSIIPDPSCGKPSHSCFFFSFWRWFFHCCCWCSERGINKSRAID